MSYTPESEPTPLRLRLGPRADVPVPPPAKQPLQDDDWLEPFDDDSGAEDPAEFENLEADETVIGPDVPTAAFSESQDVLRAAASEELQRAVEQTARRVDRWMADQRRRLIDGLDAMLVQLKEQRKVEVARLEAWKISERERVEHELAEEEERFHGRLMDELVAFEYQLGERLREQEERIARWWDEADQLAQQRFAELGSSAAMEAGEPPTT